MATLITDPYLEERLKAQRRSSGEDRFDEVWEGTCMMSPSPNTEHQKIVSRFVSILEEVVGWPELGDVFPGVNLADREGDWTLDYRVPDVAVFLRGGQAENRDTHWAGPADFLIEITSPGDRTREKIPFYAKIGVKELLVVEREPWTVELYQRQEGRLIEVGRSDVQNGKLLSSLSVPLDFMLVGGQSRPGIRITHRSSGRAWNV